MSEGSQPQGRLSQGQEAFAAAAEGADNTVSQAIEPRTSSIAALGAIVSGALILQVAATIMNTVVPLKMALEQKAPMLIGIVGAFLGGFLGSLIFGTGSPGSRSRRSWLAIVGALILLWIYRVAVRRTP